MLRRSARAGISHAGQPIDTGGVPLLGASATGPSRIADRRAYGLNVWGLTWWTRPRGRSGRLAAWAAITPFGLPTSSRRAPRVSDVETPLTTSPISRFGPGIEGGQYE